MPTAQKFSSIGAGNGFSSCSEKVDVSTYDYWTTLSGVNKNNPATSDALIHESLELAMKLWWSMHSASLYGEHSGNGGDDPPRSLTDITILDASDDPFHPIDRVCSTFINQERYSSEPRISIISRILLRHVRLYNGPTTDESRFVGYGAYKLSSLSSNFSFIGVQASFNAQAAVALGGYIKEADDDFNFYIQDFSYTKLNGMHFVGMAYAKHRSSGNPSGVVDAFNLTSSSTSTVSGVDYTASAEITGINFYTYPA